MIRFVERETEQKRERDKNLLRTVSHLKMPRGELLHLQLTQKLIFRCLKRRIIIIIIIKQ